MISAKPDTHHTLSRADGNDDRCHNDHDDVSFLAPPNCTRCRYHLAVRLPKTETRDEKDDDYNDARHVRSRQSKSETREREWPKSTLLSESRSACVVFNSVSNLVRIDKRGCLTTYFVKSSQEVRSNLMVATFVTPCIPSVRKLRFIQPEATLTALCAERYQFSTGW